MTDSDRISRRRIIGAAGVASMATVLGLPGAARAVVRDTDAGRKPAGGTGTSPRGA